MNWSYGSLRPEHVWIEPKFVSIFDKDILSYDLIKSWTARLSVEMSMSLRNSGSVTTAMLPRSLSYFRPIRKLQTSITTHRGFTRSYRRWSLFILPFLVSTLYIYRSRIFSYVILKWPHELCEDELLLMTPTCTSLLMMGSIPDGSTYLYPLLLISLISVVPYGFKLSQHYSDDIMSQRWFR